MHILRVCINRPGETAEHMLGALADRRAATYVGREPRVRGLLAREPDRCVFLAQVERDLDDIAREFAVADWRETVTVD